MKTKLWCCTWMDNNNAIQFDWQTLSYNKAASIEKFMKDTTMSWRTWKKRGCKCIKVEMTLTPIG